MRKQKKSRCKVFRSDDELKPSGGSEPFGWNVPFDNYEPRVDREPFAGSKSMLTASRSLGDMTEDYQGGEALYYSLKRLTLRSNSYLGSKPPEIDLLNVLELYRETLATESRTSKLIMHYPA